MRYAHVVYTTRLAPILFDLIESARDNFLPTLEYACRATAHSLALAPPILTNGVDDMVREVRFTTGDYTSLKAGSSVFLFVANMPAAAYKLQSKSRL